MLMIGRARDEFELWGQECREDIDDNWKELLGKVQDYATRRRLEANYAKSKGDPIEIAKLNVGWGNHSGTSGGQGLEGTVTLTP